jgi:hypothetical protein
MVGPSPDLRNAASGALLPPRPPEGAPLLPCPAETSTPAGHRRSHPAPSPLRRSGRAPHATAPPEGQQLVAVACTIAPNDGQQLTAASPPSLQRREATRHGLACRCSSRRPAARRHSCRRVAAHPCDWSSTEFVGGKEKERLLGNEWTTGRIRIGKVISVDHESHTQSHRSRGSKDW